MSRPTSDLLDFFGRKSGRSSGGARAVSKARSDERPPVTVSRRQASLGIATVGVLVAVAFVGGYFVGKTKRPAAAGPELARPALAPKDTWILRGKPIPRIGSGTENLETKAVAAMSQKYPGLVTFLAAVPAQDAKGLPSPALFRLVIRGFNSEEEGLAWAKSLSREKVDVYPLFEGCRPERAPR